MDAFVGVKLNFHQDLTSSSSANIFSPEKIKPKLIYRKAAQKTLVRKRRAQTGGEIDTCRYFGLRFQQKKTRQGGLSLTLKVSGSEIYFSV